MVIVTCVFVISEHPRDKHLTVYGPLFNRETEARTKLNFVSSFNIFSDMRL